jgi:2-keto-3-deoxy-L-rhamnonate aldolase RhmA
LVTTVNNLQAIAETEGVDGVFFGPADLSASMGHRGQPEVQKVIQGGIATVRAVGKAAGILATDPALAQQYLDAGAMFVAVGGGHDAAGQGGERVGAAVWCGGFKVAGCVVGWVLNRQVSYR